MKLSRRQVIKAGLLGGGILLVSNGVYQVSALKTSPVPLHGYVFLSSEDVAMLSKLCPVILLNHLGQADTTRHALPRWLHNLDTAISGLAPTIQVEIRQLFNLLQWGPGRWITTGIFSWSAASDKAVERCLNRWRSSRWLLLRSAYDAFVTLTMGAWYSDEVAWTSIGYPGPPVLAGGPS